MITFKSYLKEASIGPIKNGAFHEWLGKSPNEPITAADIAKGKAAGGHAAKMATFAQNFGHHKEEVVIEHKLSDLMAATHAVTGNHTIDATKIHAAEPQYKGGIGKFRHNGKIYDVVHHKKSKQWHLTGDYVYESVDEAYRGVNPHHIKTVASLTGKPGVVRVTTHIGNQYDIHAKDTGGVMPKPGEHVSKYGFVKEDVEQVDENFRELAKHGVGTLKNKAEALHVLKHGGYMDFYHPENGDKKYGKLTFAGNTHYIVRRKIESNGKNEAHHFKYHGINEDVVNENDHPGGLTYVHGYIKEDVINEAQDASIHHHYDDKNKWYEHVQRRGVQAFEHIGKATYAIGKHGRKIGYWHPESSMNMGRPHGVVYRPQYPQVHEDLQPTRIQRLLGLNENNSFNPDDHTKLSQWKAAVKKHHGEDVYFQHSYQRNVTSAHAKNGSPVGEYNLSSGGATINKSSYAK